MTFIKSFMSVDPKVTLAMLIGVTGPRAIYTHLTDAAQLAPHASEDEDNEDIYG